MNDHRAIAAIAVAITIVVAFWFGCGVKSPPIPPEEARPERITDLHGVSVKSGIRLSWQRPTRYASGKSMQDLSEFEVMRAAGDSPFEKIGDVPITDQGRIQIQHQFTYDDRGATLGSSYRYAVVARTSDDYESLPSNVVTMVRSTPTPPPNPETYVLPTPKPLF